MGIAEHLKVEMPTLAKSSPDTLRRARSLRSTDNLKRTLCHQWLQKKRLHR